MTKRARKILLIVNLLIATFTMGFQELKEIPVRILLEAPKKGPVDFPHVQHHDLGLECQTCHHNMPLEDERPDQGCRECHTQDSAITNMRAFHTTCITCHRNENRSKGTQLPFKCNDCHQSQ